MRIPRSLGGLLFLSSALACGRGATSGHESEGASPRAPASTTAPAAAADPAALAELRKHPAFAALIERAAPSAPHGGAQPTTHARRRIIVELPSRSDRAVTLRFGSADDAWIRWQPLGIGAVTGQARAATVTYEKVSTSTDLVHAVTPKAFEEARVLWNGDAPADLEWAIDLGPAAAQLRLREGQLEVVDANGRVRLTAARPLAEDAEGRDVACSFGLSREGGRHRLTLHVERSGARFPIVVDPTFSTVAPQLAAHPAASVAALADGRVLLAGGTSAASKSAWSTAEIYDPAANTWSSAGTFPSTPGSMAAGYFGGGVDHLTPLLDGHALFAGGLGQTNASTASYRWTGGTSWVPTAGQLLDPRGGDARIRLRDGRVLTAGGEWCDSSNVCHPLSTAELYAPTTDAWAYTATPLSVARNDFTLAMLPSGKVLAAGGSVLDASGVLTGASSSVDIFDPATNRWSAAADLPNPRFTYAIHTVAGGTVELVQGNTYSGTAPFSVFDRLRYDESSNTWSAPVALTTPELNGRSALSLSDGRTLFAGRADAVVYDPRTDVFTWAGEVIEGIYTGWAPIAGGRALYAGARLTAASGPTPGTEVEVWAQSTLGSACTDDFDCLSGHCTDGVCCGVAACAAGSVCAWPGSDGTCREKLGVACATAADCTSGFCVDGVCCDRACGATCEACDDPYSLGTCKTIAGAVHGKTRAACNDGAIDRCAVTTCDGVDATSCHTPAGPIACGVDQCVARVESHVGTCDASGVCQRPAPVSCGDYACGATRCNTTCTDSSQCAPGYWCSGGACIATVGLGTPCVDPTECATGTYCVDGVCCGSASCGAGGSCAVAGHVGSCILQQGAACDADLACATGHCVDGVCCESTCTDECAACDVAGSEGRCLPVSGRPHGSRAACSTDVTNPCASAACDGATTDHCAGLAGSDVVCRPSTCTEGAFSPQAVCDGKGGCPATAAATCSGYGCADPRSCATTCKDDGDCVSGYHCQSSSCVLDTNVCSPDGNTSVPVTGPSVACAPFVCRAGNCLTSCGSSADCQGGLSCEASSRTCVDLAVTARANGGGCAVGSAAAGRETSPLLLGWLTLSLIAVRARRRATKASAALLAVAGLGCSRERANAEAASRQAAAVDAGATVLQTTATARTPLETVRAAHPSLAALGDRSWERANGAWRLPARRGAQLAARIEESGALHIAAGADGAAWIELTDRDAAAGLRREGDTIRRTHPDGVQAFVGGRDDAVEDAYWVPAAARGARLRFSFAAAPGYGVRLREGRVELVDARGRVALGSAPMWAVDDAHRVSAVELRRLGDTDDESRRPTPTLEVEAILPSWAGDGALVVDPAWSAVAAMNYPRAYAIGTVLPDGRALVASGYTYDATTAPTIITTAEIYDPTANTWTLTGPLASAHAVGIALVVGGRATLFGGYDNAGVSNSSVESFDPSTNKWSSGPSLSHPRQDACGAVLPDGTAVVYGGDSIDATYASTAYVDTDVYDPTAKTTTPGAAMLAAHVSSACAQRADGTPIAAGGTDIYSSNSSSVEQFDLAKKAWVALPALSIARSGAAAALDPKTGTLFVVGGFGTTASGPGRIAQVEVLTPGGAAFANGAVLANPAISPGLAVLDSGRFLIFGGDDHPFPSPYWEVLDPTTNVVTTAGRWSVSNEASVSLKLHDGRVLLAGGNAAPGGAGGGVPTASASMFAAQPSGGACVGPDECQSGFCVDGVCCTSASCAAGSVCNGVGAMGRCAKNDALACTGAADCASGFCIDGVCCESACADVCAACDVPGSLGKCRPARGAPHGSRAACTASPSTCGLQCNGADTAACHPAPAGVECSAAGCSDGMITHVGACDGLGACSNTAVSCAGYACDPGGVACLTSCRTATDCASGFVCIGGSCLPVPGKGSDCSTTGVCASGLTCIAGVCCASSSCPASAVCPLGVGECRSFDGVRCATDGECEHGHCVDGVCCESACASPCGACDVAGQLGKCIAVRGAPHGARSCGVGSGDDPCAAVSCDGATTTSCADKPGALVSCRTASCSDAVATLAAYCDGSGACPAPTRSSCGAYACNAEGTACRTRCAQSSDCAKGSFCNVGVCQALSGTCSADGNEVEIAGAGAVDCTPYRCAAGVCLTACTSTSDCQTGSSCDTASGQCRPSTGESAKGGCIYGHTPDARAFPALALLAGAGLLHRRRRPRRRAPR